MTWSRSVRPDCQLYRVNCRVRCSVLLGGESVWHRAARREWAESGIRTGGRWRARGKWYLWDAVGVLEAGDSPPTALLFQHLQLNTLPRFGQAPWNPGSYHGPAHVSDGDRRSQEPHVNVGDRQRAFAKHECEGCG